MRNGRKQHDCVSTSRGLSRSRKEALDDRRQDERGDGGRQHNLKRDSRVYDHHLDGRRDRRDEQSVNPGDDRQRRPGWNENRDYNYSRRVTLAIASAEDLRASLDESRTHRDAKLYD